MFKNKETIILHLFVEFAIIIHPKELQIIVIGVGHIVKGLTCKL
jgi:hypothetical protein